MTQLDANQVLREVYDTVNKALKTNSIVISGLSGNNDSVSITDSTGANPLAINSSGQIEVIIVPSVVDTTTLLNAVSAGADQTSSAVNILNYNVAGVMANWASLDAADATLQFEGSLDNTIWEPLGAATTLTVATDQQHYSLVDEPYKYFRLVYTHNSVTAGTLTVKYFLRA